VYAIKRALIGPCGKHFKNRGAGIGGKGRHRVNSDVTAKVTSRWDNFRTAKPPSLTYPLWRILHAQWRVLHIAAHGAHLD
jgi:hypothetical protein